MAIMTHAKFHFNWLMLTLIFGIWASEPPPRAWRTTEKAGPDRVNHIQTCASKAMYNCTEIESVNFQAVDDSFGRID